MVPGAAACAPFHDSLAGGKRTIEIEAVLNDDQCLPVADASVETGKADGAGNIGAPFRTVATIARPGIDPDNSLLPGMKLRRRPPGQFRIGVRRRPRLVARPVGGVR